jgi:hypothetical protein
MQHVCAGCSQTTISRGYISPLESIYRQLSQKRTVDRKMGDHHPIPPHAVAKFKDYIKNDETAARKYAKGKRSLGNSLHINTESSEMDGHAGAAIVSTTAE